MKVLAAGFCVPGLEPRVEGVSGVLYQPLESSTGVLDKVGPLMSF